MGQSELAVDADIAAAAKGAPLDAADMRRRIKAIFIGSIGTLVEWYDFYAYAADHYGRRTALTLSIFSIRIS